MGGKAVMGVRGIVCVSTPMLVSCGSKEIERKGDEDMMVG